jgi:hypothetical protein
VPNGAQRHPLRQRQVVRFRHAVAQAFQDRVQNKDVAENRRFQRNLLLVFLRARRETLQAAAHPTLIRPAQLLHKRSVHHNRRARLAPPAPRAASALLTARRARHNRSRFSLELPLSPPQNTADFNSVRMLKQNSSYRNYFYENDYTRRGLRAEVVFKFAM